MRMERGTIPITTTQAPPYEMPASTIICISFACYFFLIGTFFMVKQILQRQGFCHDFCGSCYASRSEGPGLECCDCCIDFADTYPCTKVASCIKPFKPKHFSLFDFLNRSGCCAGSGNAEVCNYKTWRCDQYCHYLRCCGCIIRFNEPYVLWNPDVDPFLDLDETPRGPLATQRAIEREKRELREGKGDNKGNQPPDKGAPGFLARLRGQTVETVKSTIKDDNSQTSPVNRFTAGYGSAFGRPIPQAVKGDLTMSREQMYMQDLVYDPRFGPGLGSGFGRKAAIHPETRYSHMLGSRMASPAGSVCGEEYPPYPVISQPMSRQGSVTSLTQRMYDPTFYRSSMPYGPVGGPMGGPMGYPMGGPMGGYGSSIGGPMSAMGGPHSNLFYPQAFGQMRTPYSYQQPVVSSYARRMNIIDPLANPVKYTTPFYRDPSGVDRTFQEDVHDESEQPPDSETQPKK